MATPITPEYLREVFEYKDGELLWRLTRNSRAVKGNIAGCIDKSHGYREIRLNYARYYVHRLIWSYFNGPIPKGMSIDHINHDTLDNCIENLRLVKHQDNHRNQRLRTNNTSGYNGVAHDKNRNRWIARITVDGKNIILGRFDTIQEAISMRLFADDHYGFHSNHGRI